MGMELQLFSFPYLLLCVLLVFPILMVLKMGKRSNSNLNLPPGPRKLPFIGNLHQLVGSLPHHKLRDLARKYGSLMHIQLGEVSSVVVSSPEIAIEVMNQHDITFASRPPLLAWKILSYGCKNIAFSPYGEYWRQLRKISTLELLSTRRVRSFQWIREEEMTDLVMWISSNVQSPVNLTEKIFSLGYTITSRVAFGKKSKGQERFISIVKEATTLAGGFSVGDVFPSSKWLHVISGMRPKLERMHCESDIILNAIVEDHLQNRKNNGDASEDLVDVLMKFVEHDDFGFSLTLDNVKAVIFGIFTAGSETSATTVDWAMAEMMKNPTILNKAQSEVRRVFDKRGRVEEDGLQELNYLQLVIKETLRLHPPLPLLLPRVCGEQCEIGGFEIPINTKVIVNAWAMGRDPKYWKEPEKFNPDRFLEIHVDFRGTNFEYIPFGAGRRMCPGVVFGLNSMEYQLSMLLYHFDWKIANGGMKNEELNMTEAFGVTVRRKEDLYLVATPYQPPSSS